MYSGSAKSALSYLLMGTGWTAGIVDVEGIHDLETEKKASLLILTRYNKLGAVILFGIVRIESQPS